MFSKWSYIIKNQKKSIRWIFLLQLDHEGSLKKQAFVD